MRPCWELDAIALLLSHRLIASCACGLRAACAPTLRCAACSALLFSRARQASEEVCMRRFSQSQIESSRRGYFAAILTELHALP
mmetsp:Transcript_36202/g.116258  ORF Transcript_36202/g.116258 Transcript_36202/m.116258 type:complete len:84 (-) Transcript_36202:85-336(-)